MVSFRRPSSCLKLYTPSIHPGNIPVPLHSEPFGLMTLGFLSLHMLLISCAVCHSLYCCRVISFLSYVLLISYAVGRHQSVPSFHFCCNLSTSSRSNLFYPKHLPLSPRFYCSFHSFFLLTLRLVGPVLRTTLFESAYRLVEVTSTYTLRIQTVLATPHGVTNSTLPSEHHHVAKHAPAIRAVYCLPQNTSWSILGLVVRAVHFDPVTRMLTAPSQSGHCARNLIHRFGVLVRLVSHHRCHDLGFKDAPEGVFPDARSLIGRDIAVWCQVRVIEYRLLLLEVQDRTAGAVHIFDRL